MSDLSAVRSEIKAWERTFKTKNGRDPSVQDIKDRPEIAEKYKLYKKLSKAAAAATEAFPTLNKQSDHPTTPPLNASSSLTLLKKRTVEHASPLSGFNPFSPVKNKGKAKETDPSANLRERPRHPNPFATPKRKSKHTETKESSPDLFPPIQHPHAQPFISGLQMSPAPTSPLSRARKRLRGEPVSPSPNKEKRRRLSPKTLLFPDEICDLEDGHAVDSSFVNDSPVKTSTSGKTFKLLFNEPLPQTEMQSKRTFSRSKTTPASAGLFQPRSRTSTSVFGNEQGSNSRGPTPLGFDGNTDRPKAKKNKESVVLRRTPDKDDHLSPGEPPQIPPVSSSSTVPSSGRGYEYRTSAKRTLSDASVEHKDTSVTQLALLPPSPPPASSYYGSSSQHKARGKGRGLGRKKVKVSEKSDDSLDDDSKDASIRLVDRSRGLRTQPLEDRDDIYSDPILRLPTRGEPPDTSTTMVDVGNDHVEFHIDLPDKLRQVLAITSSKAQDFKEERLVHALLYGRRVTPYDPLKGGEIWDVGENVDKFLNDVDTEDDWEGEPVPWEVGEL